MMLLDAGASAFHLPNKRSVLTIAYVQGMTTPFRAIPTYQCLDPQDLAFILRFRTASSVVRYLSD